LRVRASRDQNVALMDAEAHSTSALVEALRHRRFCPPGAPSKAPRATTSQPGSATRTRSPGSPRARSRQRAGRLHCESARHIRADGSDPLRDRNVGVAVVRVEDEVRAGAQLDLARHHDRIGGEVRDRLVRVHIERGLGQIDRPQELARIVARNAEAPHRRRVPVLEEENAGQGAGLRGGQVDRRVDAEIKVADGPRK